MRHGTWAGTATAVMRYDIMRARRLSPSMIDRIAYDEEQRILIVSFRDTGKYLYHDIPSTIFEAFCAAPSAGSFFNTYVKDHFRCTRDPERKRFGPKA